MSQALADATPKETVKVHYWVLGSYAKADNAHAEMERLAEMLGKPVEIRFDTNLAVFRVLTPAAETNREELGDETAWLLPLEIAASDLAPTAQASAPSQDDTPEEAPTGETSAATNELPILIEEPLEEPLYPEFGDEESLHEYCERLPDARLCQHPKIEKAVEIDRVLAEQRDKLQGVCDEITHPAWLETCRSLYPED